MTNTDSPRTTPQAESMGSAPMWRLLVHMSGPPTLAIIVMAMYSIVDRVFVGRAVGIDALSGLSAAFPAQLLAVGLGLLPGLGGMSVISRALGAQNAARASRVLGSSLAIVFPMYLILVTVGLFQLEPLLGLLGASANTAPHAREYLVIILPGSLLVMVAMSCNQYLMAEGRPTIAMILLAGGAVLNIALDALFVLVLGWGVSGAAAATVIAQGTVVAYLLWFYLSGRSVLTVSRDALRPRLPLVWAVITLGLPICLIEVARSFVVVVINNILSGYDNGDSFIALFGVINSVLEFALAPFIGVALAYLPLAAYNYGARSYARVRQAIWQSCLGATIGGALIAAVLLPLAGVIIRLFTEPGALPEEGAVAMRVVLMVLPIVGIEFISSIAFQALGKAWPSVALTVAQRIVFLLVYLKVLSSSFGVWGVWWSFPATDLTAMLLGVAALTIVWKRVERWGEADAGNGSTNFDITHRGQ